MEFGVYGLGLRATGLIEDVRDLRVKCKRCSALDLGFTGLG